MKKIIRTIASLLFAVPGVTQTTTYTGALTPQSVNGVISADQLAGIDIGAKVNTAFTSCAGPNKSCKITLPPGQSYLFSTRIIVPGDATAINSVMQLDCQGSTLTWTGTGDAIQVLTENVNNPSGYIANCIIVNGTSNTVSTNAIHQFSRNAFEYRTVAIQGFSNAGSSGIFLDNVAETWGGYNERTVFDHVTTSLTTKGIRLLGSDGGTNSFARVVMRGGFCNAGDGQICLSVEGNGTFQSADAYDGFFDMRGNITFSGGIPARAISTTKGGDIRTGVFNVGFEGPAGAYLTYVDNIGTSLIDGLGTLSGGGLSSFNSGTSDQMHVPQLVRSFVVQASPFNNGVQQANNSKVIWDGANLRYAIPVLGGFGAGYYQIFGRVTTDPGDPESDAAPSNGNKQFNLLYVDAVHGVGVGPGYGKGVNTGGTTVPLSPLEATGFGVRNPALGTVADGGASVVRSVDGSGNIVDFVVSGVSGGASNHYKMNFRDYTTSTAVTGLDCFSNTTVVCNIPNLTLGGSTPVNGLQGIGAKVATATGTFTPGNLRTTDANGTEVDSGVVGFNGTKTAGSCVFTIVNGIITNVTGC